MGECRNMDKIKVDPEVYFALRLLDSFEKTFPIVFQDKKFKDMYLSLVNYLDLKCSDSIADDDCISDIEMFFLLDKHSRG